MTSSIISTLPKNQESEGDNAAVVTDIASKSPDNVSKEELLDVLQKMNKKVKALTSQRTQLAERCKAAESDKLRLLTLVREEILNDDVNIEDGVDQIEQLKVAWRAADERNSLALQELQNEYKIVALQVQGDVSKVKEAVEKESEARAEQIRLQAVAEAMASGNEAWEGMRQQMVLRQREETAILRQQLHEQYDLQLAQQEEDFRRKVQEEVTKARADLLTVPPPSEEILASEDVESMKVKHRDEVEKLKSAAAAQLNSFKKKVAAARTAELEKLKSKFYEEAEATYVRKQDDAIKVHRAEIESLRAQILAESSATLQTELESFEEAALKVRNDISVAQKNELERVRSEATLEAESSASQRVAILQQQQHEAALHQVGEATQHSLAEQIEVAKVDIEQQLLKVMTERLREQQEAHKEEMDRLLSVSSEHMAEVEGECESSAATIVTLETALHDSKVEIESLTTSFAKRLESAKILYEKEKSTFETTIIREMEEKQQILLDEFKCSALADTQGKVKEALASHNQELEKVLCDSATEMKRFKDEREQEFNHQLEKATAASAKAGEEVLSIRQALDDEIAKQLLDLENAKEAEIQSLKEELKSSTNRSLDLSANIIEIQGKLDDSVLTHQQTLENALENAAAARESLKEEMEHAFNLKLNEAASKAAAEALSGREVLENEIHKQYQGLENAMAVEIQVLKEELESAATQALEKSEIVASEYKEMLESALQSAAAERENLKVEMEHAFNLKLNEAESKAAVDAQSGREVLENEIYKQHQDLETAMAVEIQRLKEELKSVTAQALEQSAASANLETLKSQLSQQVAEKQLMSQQLSDDLAQAQQQQILLQGELQDLKAKAAITAAAKDGEESFNKKLEEALTTQRASFDEQIMVLKDRYSNEMQALEIKIQATSENPNNAENSVSSTNEEVAALQHKLSSLELKVQTATENLVTAEEFRQKEVASIMQQHHADLARLNQNMVTTHDAYTCKLSEENRARLEGESKVAELQAASQAASVALETLKQDHASKFSSIQHDFTNQLSQSKQLLEARVTEVWHLSTTLSDAEKQHENLTVQHEELSKAFSKFQREVERSSSESSSRVEMLVVEKQSFLKELSKSSEVIESMRTKHADELLTLISTINGSQQQWDDEKQELEKKIQDLNGIAVEANKASHVELSGLRQKVEDLNCHIATMTASHEKTLLDLHEDFESKQSVLSDDQIEQVRQGIFTAKDAEIRALKTEYDEKLTSSAKKTNAAVDLVKKMKVASAKKVEMLNKKREQDSEQYHREKEELESLLRTNFEEQLKSLSCEMEAMMQNSKLLRQTHESKILSIETEASAQIEVLKYEHQLQLTALRQELADASEEMKVQALTLSDDVQREWMQKMQVLVQNHEHAAQKVKADREEDIANVKAERDEAIKFLTIEKDAAYTKLEAEKSEIETNAKVELDNRLRVQVAQNSRQMEDLTKAMEAHADKLTKHFQEKVATAEAAHTARVAELESQLRAKDDEVSKMVRLVKTSTVETSTLKDEKDSIHNKLKSEAVVQQALRKKLEELQKALSDSQSSYSTMSVVLERSKAKVEDEKAILQEQFDLVDQERNTAKVKIEELSGKLSALGENMSAILDDKKDLENKLEQATKKGAKLQTTETELSSLREQVNFFKLEQTKNRSLLEKLQAEKEASEQKHGQRTALAGMLEEQLAELNDKNADANAKLEVALYDLSSKEEAIHSIQEQLGIAEKALAECQNTNRKANESLSVVQRGVDVKKTKMVDQLQREVQSLQQQMLRKSAAAQRLIQEREAECIDLRKQNKFLSQEVDKGSLSDRRIFELAAQQSNRESVASAEIEIRDKVVERLTEKLVANDGDLASAEYQVTQIDNQVAELCRVRRREDVNLDYLKSIVVQYLSKPPGSTERGALLPVLATLLQFDQNDYKTIEEGKNKLSWWGTVAPIFIEAPAQVPASATLPPEQMSLLLSGGSAEVTISSTTTNHATNGRPKSSLEF